jgi:putative ABC transport system substrate-binding protein
MGGASITSRFLVLLLAVATLGSPLAHAQHASRTYRLGVLNSVPGRNHVTKALEDSLRERGYVAGGNLAIDWSLGERLSDGAARLVALKPDVIVAISLSAAVAAKQATATVPIVVLVIGDAVADGLVSSLAHPGGNITGIATEVTAELSTKQLQLLTEAAPTVRRVAVLLNPDWAPNAARWRHSQEAARTLRTTLFRVEMRGATDMDAAFATINREHADGLFVFGDPLVFTWRYQIADLALRHRLPSVSQYREAAEAGGLLSYGPNFATAAHQMAGYVDRIFRGARPADLPIEQPTTFELVVNLATARALRLTLPPSLLLRVDDTIPDGRGR